MKAFLKQNYYIFFIRSNTFFLVLPLLVYLCIFYVYPILQLVGQSLFDPEITLKNYGAFLEIKVYQKIMINTFVIAFFTTAFCILLGYPVAYLMCTVSQRASQVIMFLIVVPFWISILVRSYAWMVLLGRNGLVNQFLLGINIIDSPLHMMHNRFSVYVGMVNVLLPFLIFPLYSVMKGIDKNLLKAAYVLGTPPWKAFIKVFFPLSLSGVAGGGLLVFIIALGFYITPALLGGPKDTMISLLIQAQIEELLNWGFGSALATILMIAALIVFVIYNRFLGIDKLTAR